MEFTVRPARLEDAEGVARAHEEASAELFLEFVGKPLAELFSFDARVEECRSSIAKVFDKAQILVVESGGRIIGMRRPAPRGDG